MFNYVKTIPETIEVDVLVCGSGCAGIGAAIAAARNGASTMVLEKNGFSGGIITAVHNPFFDGLTDLRTGEVIVKGIAFELYAAMGYAALTDTHLPGSHQTVDPERFKLVTDRFYAKHQVRTWFHSPVVDVVTEQNRITGVITANKSGLCHIAPKVVVDATGDGDIAAWAGAPFVADTVMQPMTLHFRIGNVRVTEELPERCGQVLQTYFQQGSMGTYGGPWMFSLADDEITINATRISGNGLSAEDKSAAESRGREDAWAMFEAWKKELPEFESAYFITSGPEIGVRETRRIVGDYAITVDDIYQCRTFSDAVVKGAWFLDMHPSDGSVGIHPHTHYKPKPYDIPFRTLLPQMVDNLLVAGRCHSATREALSSTRVTITAMGMGEAAGTAAAMAAKQGKSVRDIPVQQLQDRLLRQEALVLNRDRT